MDNSKQQVNSNILGRPVLFFLIDAFRWDYLTPQDSPTMYRLSQKSVYVKKLITSSGFAQRSTISTGSSPVTHGSYAMYTFDPDTSPFKLLKYFSLIFKLIPKSGIFFKISRKIINQIPKLTKSYAPPARIPTNILHLISVKEDLQPIQDAGATDVESIYDILRTNRLKYLYYMAPVSRYDDKTEAHILQIIKERKHQIIFVQFSNTDSIVHESGTENEIRKKIVQTTDSRIENLVKEFEKTYSNPWIVLVGDHGMTDVSEYIDIWGPTDAFAKENKLVHGKDYLMFLDSTLARFWFFNNRAKESLTPFLQELLKSKGFFMDKEYMDSRNIPYNPKLYGEMIWRANAKVGIFPDYFHWPQDKYKAMHGFDCFEEDMKGTAIYYNKDLGSQKIIEQGRLEDVCSSLCDILKIPHPSSNEGKSVFSDKS